jgi:hypothetical protein
VKGIRVPELPWLSRAERQERRIDALRESFERLGKHADQHWIKAWADRALRTDNEIESGRG